MSSLGSPIAPATLNTVFCRVSDSGGALLTAAQAAERLGLSIETLKNWRRPGNVGARPLPYLRIGRSVRYQLSDLLAFMEAGREVPNARRAA